MKLILLFFFSFLFNVFSQPWNALYHDIQRSSYAQYVTGPTMGYNSPIQSWKQPAKPPSTHAFGTTLVCMGENPIIGLTQNLQQQFPSFPVSTHFSFINWKTGAIENSFGDGSTFYAAVSPDTSSIIAICTISFLDINGDIIIPPVLACYNNTGLSYTIVLPELTNHTDIVKSNFMISMDFIQDATTLLITNRGSTLSGDNTYYMVDTWTAEILWMQKNLFMTFNGANNYELLYPPTVDSGNTIFYYAESYAGINYVSAFQTENFYFATFNQSTTLLWSYNFTGYFTNQNSTITIPMWWSGVNDYLLLGISSGNLTSDSGPSYIILLDPYGGVIFDYEIINDSGISNRIKGYAVGGGNGFSMDYFYVTTSQNLYRFYIEYNQIYYSYHRSPPGYILTSPVVDSNGAAYFTVSGVVVGYSTYGSEIYYYNALSAYSDQPVIPFNDPNGFTPYILVTFSDGSIGMYSTTPINPNYPVQPPLYPGIPGIPVLTDTGAIILGAVLGSLYFVICIGSIVAVCVYKSNKQNTYKKL